MDEKKTILIVEDDKYIIHFLSVSFREENYGFQVAKSVKEAVSLFYANRPDVVILDLGLPDGDGMEVIERIREIADTPVIVVSARQEEDEKIRALDAGADDYVTKPFYMGELLARIRAALRKTEKHSREKETRFEDGDLCVDYGKRRVEVDLSLIHI